MGQGMSSGGSMSAPNQGYGSGSYGGGFGSALGAQNSFNGGQYSSSDPSQLNGYAGNSGSLGSGYGSGSSGGVSGKGGAQQMGVPNSAYGSSNNQWAPGMWGQSANQGLIPGLGAYQFAGPGYGGPGWNAPNIQGGPLPGQGGTAPPGTTPPSNIDNTLPGSGAVRNERGTVTNPPGGTFMPGLPNVVPAGATGSPVVPMPGIQPGNVGPPGFNTGTTPTTTPSGSAPVTSVPGSSGSGLASVPKSAVQDATASTAGLPGLQAQGGQWGAPVTGALPTGGGTADTKAYATNFVSPSLQPGTLAYQRMAALPQSFTVADFNKVKAVDPVLATQMLAKAGQPYRDAVMQANGWNTAQMNQYINQYGSGALPGFTPDKIALLKSLGIT